MRSSSSNSSKGSLGASASEAVAGSESSQAAREPPLPHATGASTSSWKPSLSATCPSQGDWSSPLSGMNFLPGACPVPEEDCSRWCHCSSSVGIVLVTRAGSGLFSGELCPIRMGTCSAWRWGPRLFHLVRPKRRLGFGRSALCPVWWGLCHPCCS